MTVSGKELSKQKLISIQLLRAMAALSVVVGHAITEVHQSGSEYTLIKFNFGIGVDVFFIVSGFVMVLTGGGLAGKRGAPLEFMRRRVIRVVPLYWFYTIGMLIAIWLFSSQLNHSTTNIRQVVCSFAFLPCYSHEDGYSPVLRLGWTLNYEMFFYVIFAVALVFRPARMWFQRIWMLLLAVIVARVLVGGPFRFWGDAVVLEFLAGAMLALLFQKLGSMRSATVFVLAVLTAGVLYFCVTAGNANRFIALGLPAIVFAAGFIFALPESWERHSAGFAHFLGDSSYSLYLCHPFALALVKIVWSRLDPTHAYPTVYLVAALVASVTAARLSFLWLEKPLTQWLLRRSAVQW